MYSNWCAQQRSKAALKIKARQASVKDTDCSFGPPDKKQHFSSVQGKKGKGKLKADDNKKKLNDAKNVEVMYADGKCDRICENRTQ